MDVVTFIPILPFVNVLTFISMAIGGPDIAERVIFALGHTLFWTSGVLYFKLKKNWAMALLALSGTLLSFGVYELLLGIMSV